MLLSSLRQQILDRAIRGQLVEQRPEEGTAEELYQQIQAEKKRLIANGTIKKEKPLDTLEEDKLPFLIPETWRWVPFGSIVINRDSERIPLSVSEREKLVKTFDYYGASGVIDKVDKYIFDKPLLLIGEDGANLLTRSKPIAFIARGQYWVNNHAHVLDVGQHVVIEYLELYINSISLAPYVTGTAQPKMNQERMNNIPIALPPLAEQRRIVEKVEALFSALNTVESSQKRISAIQTELTKRLLERAIQGKLVPQLPEEGTAEDLYQQIQAEKQRLIASGSIKKEKPLSPIEEKDLPFDIPETWKWVRLGEIGNTNIGLTYKPQDIASTGTTVLRSSNIQDGQMKYDDIVRVTCDIPANKMCHKGDILICARNGSKKLVGKAALIDCEGMSFGAFMAIYRSICNPYIVYVINSSYFRNSLLNDSDTTTINQLTQDMLKNFILPLPPQAEQKRIVAKIDELLKMLSDF